MFAEGEENNLDDKALNERWARWYKCGLCEQDYHGVVAGALGWACWRTYVARPETDWAHGLAMTQLGNGLHDATNHEDALSVRETQLSMRRRLGVPEQNMLVTQGNLARTLRALGRLEEAMRMRQDVYSGYMKLCGEEHGETIRAALNLGVALHGLDRLKEAKALLRKTIPVARRILGANNSITLTMKMNYAQEIYQDDCATLDDLREAVTTLEETERIARRVLGGAHPLTMDMEKCLRKSRAVLRAREAQSPGDLCEALGAI